MEPHFMIDGPAKSDPTVVLAHGAGAPMDSPFMTTVAQGLSARGLRVVRFEFPYMRARREGRGARGAPDPAPALLETWRSVIETLGGGSKLVLGGKSLGGRIASLLCDEAGARGLVCLGYPFHPPGRPERLRVTHLAGLQTPALIVQGTRDTLGDREEVPAYELSPKIRLAWIEDGDHSLRPRKSSGRTEEQNLAQAVEVVARFVNDLPR